MLMYVQHMTRFYIYKVSVVDINDLSSAKGQHQRMAESQSPITRITKSRLMWRQQHQYASIYDTDAGGEHSGPLQPSCCPGAAMCVTRADQHTCAPRRAQIPTRKTAFSIPSTRHHTLLSQKQTSLGGSEKNTAARAGCAHSFHASAAVLGSAGCAAQARRRLTPAGRARDAPSSSITVLAGETVMRNFWLLGSVIRSSYTCNGACRRRCVSARAVERACRPTERAGEGAAQCGNADRNSHRFVRRRARNKARQNVDQQMQDNVKINLVKETRSCHSAAAK